MNQTKMLSLGLTLSLVSTLLAGCAASVKMADIPSTASPRDEIAKLVTDLNAAATKNVDVLAASEFEDSKDHLSKANQALENKQPQNEILDELRKSRGYLNQANALASGRESHAAALLTSRQWAIKAGAKMHPELQSDFKSLDSDLSSHSKKLNKLEAKELAEYQERYVDLEKRSMILNQLGQAQAMINGAKNDDAEKMAPASLKKAEVSLESAESAISTNLRNPEGYQAAALLANKDATKLVSVLRVIHQNNDKMTESAAIASVDQNETIVGLTSKLGVANAKSKEDQLALTDKNTELSVALKSKDQELDTASNKVKIQNALESARNQFSKEEAEAYQQGSNLVIRLKQVGYLTGRSDLPEQSLPLLEKVSDIAKSLKASQITVEGHTDSIGSADENRIISQKRASTVASYFRTRGFHDTKIESEGYGFKKPIASNKSKEGRAQNRRVDVIITPEAPATPAATE